MKPNKPELTVLALVCLFSSLFSYSCVSTREFGPIGAQVRLMDRFEIAEALGYRFQVNPFLAPEGIFQGQKDEFVVLQLRLNYDEAQKITIDAALVNSEGVKVARLYDRTALEEYWSYYQEDPNQGIRERKLGYCLPSSHFGVARGSTQFYLVFIGKNPIRRPAQIKVHLLCDKSDDELFEIPLPDVASKTEN